MGSFVTNMLAASAEAQRADRFKVKMAVRKPSVGIVRHWAWAHQV